MGQSCSDNNIPSCILQEKDGCEKTPNSNKNLVIGFPPGKLFDDVSGNGIVKEYNFSTPGTKRKPRSRGQYLCELARTGDVETLELILVAYGGISDLNHLCDDGMSPLHFAVTHSQYAAAKIMLSYGADVDIRTWNGKSSIMLARESGNMQIIQLFEGVK